MPSLNSEISFDVRFLFTGAPSIRLTADTTLTPEQQEDLKIYFAVTQPDGIAESGDFDDPDIEWDGSALNTFTKVLRLGSDQLYQKGVYAITMFAQHPDFTDGAFTRSFTFNYKPITQVIREDLDVFTPMLRYVDRSVYTKASFSILSQTSSWTGTTTAGALTPSSTPVFDLEIDGEYYDASYDIEYTKNVIYEDATNAWLTVEQGFTYEKTGKAYLPQSTTTLLTYLDQLKAGASTCGCSDFNSLYQRAAALYTHIRDKVCARSVFSLKSYFDEFYRLTHNNQNYSYSHSGGVIPAYDFTTGCGGSGGASGTVETYQAEYTSASEAEDGETEINLALPTGARVVSVSKGINPLSVSEWDYASPTMYLSGVALAFGETLFVTYSV